jgi:hypothetical protein
MTHDVNDILREEGADALRRVFDSALTQAAGVGADEISEFPN